LSQAQRYFAIPPKFDPEKLGKAGTTKIKQWVNAGGTLVAVGRACDLLTAPEMELLEARREYRLDEDTTFQEKKAEKKKEEAPSRVPGTAIEDREQFLSFITAEEVAPRPVPGVMLRIRLDGDHWLSAGYDSLAVTFAMGRNIYAPLKRSQGRNVACFAEKDKMLISGYAWRGATLKQLAFKPYLMYRPVGEGHVIGFTEEVNFRAQLDGMNRLFLNAVLLGPGH